MNMHVIIAAVAFAMAPLVAVAEARPVSVSTRQTDYLDAASVDALHRQLADAARDACGISDVRGLAGLRQNRACRLDAVDRAVADLNKPTLTALNQFLDARLRINSAREPLTANQLAVVNTTAAQLRVATIDNKVLASNMR